MPRHLSTAQWFLLGGGVLALLSLILWAALPVKLVFPPYLITALFALGYGLFCLARKRRSGNGKPKDPRA
ncbi:MAG TPA: hypothetical protein VL981_01660 [Candidatus Methylacidiphilales bacterium]|nr:hypothetical protein [Candidatus Methylacidiphilales bacterium]